ncbi:MAG: hypothetical protein C4617_05555 [Candidatus Liberibacter europaeus]|uniref:Bbp19-like phage domain-containing protein n=1 Tax=Candidatus Liberibacter europaeus TaxID=744859 RepID=A0A2T4VWC8_9HYPH|nr:hypothetical protein [Candidatus Liberibacter europaeus]PTL86077.1 MAG: hypothetical protein C4617_05555 [Candidatus Liberibacter europaeus]
MDYKSISEGLNEAFGGSVDIEKVEQRLIEMDYKQAQYKQVYATPEGKWVLQNILNQCGLFLPTKSDNPIDIAMKSAERNIALYILSQLNLGFEEIYSAVYMELINSVGKQVD